MAVFQGKSFCFLGEVKSEVRDMIVTQGGKVSDTLAGSPDFVVCCSTDLNTSARKVAALGQSNLVLVTEKFVHHSLHLGRLANPYEFGTCLGLKRRSETDRSSSPFEMLFNTTDAHTPTPKRLKMNAEDTRQKLELIFSKYADSDNATHMGQKGVALLCQDLGIEMGDTAMFILAWKLGGVCFCEFDRHEFVNALIALGCRSLEELKLSLNYFSESVRLSPIAFREFYCFVYTYSLPPGQKSLSVLSAIQLWEVVFAGRFACLPQWAAFLRRHHTNTIPRDTWLLFLRFCLVVNPDFSNYSDEEAWPVLLDQFVESARSARAPH